MTPTPSVSIRNNERQEKPVSSITKTSTKNGDTRYRVRYRDPDGRSREQRFKKRVDADRFLHKTEAAIDRGDYIDPRAGRTTAGEYIRRHEATRVGRRPSTVARDKYLVNTYILPAFGSRQLRSIRPLEVRTWVAGLTAKGLAPATVRKAAQLLSADLEAACNDGLIGRNPARGFDLPRIEKVEMRFLAPSEIESLARAIDPRYACLVYTAAYTGLRFGELAALRVSRLDMLRRTIRVEETLTEVEGHLAFGPPKTAAARRTVTLPKTLVELLATHLARCPVGADGLIFTAPAGGPLRATQFRTRVWNPAVAASVGTPCRFHDLRHSAAALLVREKVHPKVIQQRLGHASIRTTLDVYGHVFEGLDAAAAEALDKTLSERAVGFSWG